MLQWAKRALLVLLASVMTGKAGLMISFVTPEISLIWLPAGIGVAALLRWGESMFIPVFISALLLSLDSNLNWGVGAFIAFSNALGSMVCFWILRNRQFYQSVMQLRDVFWLCIAAFIAMTIPATLGTTALTHEGLSFEPQLTWLCWWAGDTVGVLLATQQARLTPDFALVDSLGRQIRLHQFLAKDEKIWIADFVYTRCQTLCSALGTVFQRLQQNIIEQGLQDQVGLLSISFDPRNDTPAALYQYQQRMRLDPAVWQIVSLQFESDRRALLDSFGIIVIPAPLGEFEHNAALHLLTSEGNLVQIVDLAQADIVIDLALSLAHQRKAR